MIMRGLHWTDEEVSTIDADNNTVNTSRGNKITYDYLVLSPGVNLRYDKIEGATEALNDPNSPVGSIYRLDYAYKACNLRQNFKGGKAIFMLP